MCLLHRNVYTHVIENEIIIENCLFTCHMHSILDIKIYSAIKIISTEVKFLCARYGQVILNVFLWHNIITSWDLGCRFINVWIIIRTQSNWEMTLGCRWHGGFWIIWWRAGDRWLLSRCCLFGFQRNCSTFRTVLMEDFTHVTSFGFCRLCYVVFQRLLSFVPCDCANVFALNTSTS